MNILNHIQSTTLFTLIIPQIFVMLILTLVLWGLGVGFVTALLRQ